MTVKLKDGEANGNEMKNAVELNTEETKFLPFGKNEESRGPKFGKRHGQMVMFFSLLVLSFCIKVSINIALVAMTDQKPNTNSTVPTYNWTDKNIIISAFFWGYTLPQVMAGWLATHYGPKWFLIGTMSISSLVGFLIPTSAALLGSYGVMICRALQGLCQGFVIPSIHMLLARWVPPEERGMVSSVVYAGSACGTIIAMILTGYISASSYGWPMSFYFFNGVGLLWVIWFSFFGYSTPANHPHISEEEQNYIENSLGSDRNKKTSATPWVKILTSVPFWALLLAQSGFTWGFWTMLSEIPLYMDKVMMFNLKSNSLLSSLPYLVHWILLLIFGYITDKLITKKVLNIGTTRKLMNSIGFLIPAISLVMLGDSGPESTTKALILLTIAVGFGAIATNGFLINHIDLTPNHAGVTMGLSNFIGSIFALAAPLLAQFIVKDEHDPNQWKIIFYFAAAIYFVTNSIFVFFGSSNIQPWNDDSRSEGVNSE